MEREGDDDDGDSSADSDDSDDDAAGGGGDDGDDDESGGMSPAERRKKHAKKKRLMAKVRRGRHRSAPAVGGCSSDVVPWRGTGQRGAKQCSVVTIAMRPRRLPQQRGAALRH
jgi:hypothetical protein